MTSPLVRGRRAVVLVTGPEAPRRHGRYRALVVFVGLTGGIGSGKSTVASALKARGAVIIDADGISREIVEPGGPAYQPIVEHFGAGVVGPDGRLNRPALAALVFADPEQLAVLNGLTHPLIRDGILERAAPYAETGDVVVVDHPLLNADDVARFALASVIVVDTPEEVAVARLVAHRGFSEADARARIAAQVSRQERRQLASFVVDNSGDEEALRAQVDQLWEWLLQIGMVPPSR
jgi:dephospho-CoA kinase